MRPPFPLCLLLLAASCAAFAGDRPAGPPTSPGRGVVVSEHPLATAAGLRILEQGGNAADAAVATAFALAVVYPQAGNLGGGGFALWVAADPDREPLCFDFRETAPRALVPELFLDAGGEVVARRSLFTHLAAGVPGSPAGLWELHRSCGRLPFEAVIRPALDLARDGFPVDPWLAHDLRRPALRERLQGNAAARAIFYPGGEPLSEGDRLRQPALARTLSLFARDGPDAFYRGPLAAALVRDMQAHGGVLGAEDLAAYRVHTLDPLRGRFRGFEVLSMPPPSSGGLILLQVLGILEGLPLEAAMEEAEPGEHGLSERLVHWWIEALRGAFSDRVVHMGDPAFWDVPVEALLSPEWIATRRAAIGERATPDVEPMPLPLPETGETTHLSVLDAEGNAVSLTTTLNTSFGTGLLVEELGFFLNNEMDDFSIRAGVPNTYGLVGSEANQLAPLKRPLSSMTPTVVRDASGRVRLVLGSPGGPRIITAVTQVLLRVLVHGQELEDAVRAPRLHQQFSPPATRFETGWSPALLRALEARGHEIVVQDRRFGSVQAILVPPDRPPTGFSDPRRGGAAGIEGHGVDPPALPTRPHGTRP